MANAQECHIKTIAPLRQVRRGGGGKGSVGSSNKINASSAPGMLGCVHRDPYWNGTGIMAVKHEEHLHEYVKGCVACGGVPIAAWSSRSGDGDSAGAIGLNERRFTSPLDGNVGCENDICGVTRDGECKSAARQTQGVSTHSPFEPGAEQTRKVTWLRSSTGLHVHRRLLELQQCTQQPLRGSVKSGLIICRCILLALCAAASLLRRLLAFPNICNATQRAHDA